MTKKYEVLATTQYRRDYKRIKKRGFSIPLLDEVVELLEEGQPLPAKYHDHALTGNYAGCRECHITPDWLLIYRIYGDVLVLALTRTGTHSDLF